MSDNETPPAGNGEQPQEGQSQTGQTPIKSLPPDIQVYIDELRKENAKWRTEKKKAEEKALRDNQEWQKLAEEREKELEEMRPYKERAELLEEGFNATLEARLKTLSQDVRKNLVEPVRASMDAVSFAKWLDANEAMLKTKAPPPMNAGEGSTAKPADPVNLTPAELVIAQAAGMTPAQYVANRKKLAEHSDKNEDTGNG